MTVHDTIENAAAIIRKGGLVAIPTETVYGLAADATNDRAVARIFEAKGRPQFNPLIMHVANIEMAAQYVHFPPLAEKLAKAFWPGALTLVLPRREDCAASLLVSAGLDTIAIRMPNHKIAQDLIKAVDRPLAAPSANKSGSLSPTLPEHVRDSLGYKVDMILDGGACSIGIESTIIKIDGDSAVMLRPGGITCEEIKSVMGMPLSTTPSAGAQPEAPGMLPSHYAPRASIRLNVVTPKPDEAYLALGHAQVNTPYRLNLSESGDLCEAAANLFAHMRALDDICSAHNLSGIAASPIPMDGLGEAINDRLTRAAAPRP
ncbi:MAG: threonylcarbamoyl-AMP synthase [Marinicaulis sp.]|nr:threonylcarbamoyl-AMP synthase [Marinicaulis sp.]